VVPTLTSDVNVDHLPECKDKGNACRTRIGWYRQTAKWTLPSSQGLESTDSSGIFLLALLRKGRRRSGQRAREFRRLGFLVLFTNIRANALLTDGFESPGKGSRHTEQYLI
jgi:hypothetical protein